MRAKAIKTRIFQPGENLVDFIAEHVSTLAERDVLVVTSKIAALSENRLVPYESEEQKEALIKQESDFAVRTPYAWLTIKDNMVVASAGIDSSNANGHLILLPKNSHKLAHELRHKLKEQYGIKDLGVLIIDSRIMPMRRGALGMAFGYAGFKGLYSYVGKPDLFGRPLKVSRTNIADSLATTSTLLMGEGSESQPLALISEMDLEFTDEPIPADELRITFEEDMYGPLFRATKNEK